MNVVKESDWLADVWILFRVWASWSLSACEAVDIELIESWRLLKPGGVDRTAGEFGFDVLLLAILREHECDEWRTKLECVYNVCSASIFLCQVDMVDGRWM